MFGRPRCREWTPLATQQLRLRSLIQIVGYNIRPPEWCSTQCSFYLTLHHTTMSAPFYTSERISSPHPKWKEIDAEITQRMSAANVVIRIWCHILLPTNDNNSIEKVQDTVIQTWGIYFSGLRYIGANLALNFTSDCFKYNTLVFQMHGGYFCSYKSLKLDVIPPENEMEHGSLSSDSSGKTNISSKITIESKFVQKIQSRSVSPSKSSRKVDKEYSKSQSPVERAFKQSFPTMRSSPSLNIVQNQQRERRRDHSNERTVSESNQIYVHSPDNLDVKEFTTTDLNCDSLSKTASQEEIFASKIDLSETAENYDLRNESDWAPKYRYLTLNFLKSEIRPSYNATKLQKLHLLQYSIKKRQEAVQEIKERIYKKSALSNLIDFSLESNFRFKSRSQKSLFSLDESEGDEVEKCSSQSDLSLKNGRIKLEDKPQVSNGPRLTLKLNDLLSFKSKPSPFQRAEHVRLTKQLEILRFKRIILSDERDSKLANIRRLKEMYNKLSEENQDVGTELMQDYHALSRKTEVLRETRQSCDAVRELAARAHAALWGRRVDLLRQLMDIFYIEQKDASVWTICNVPLAICGDENPRNLSPISDSVAAGLAAQATCLTAALLNQPLRYKVTLLGSASKILDVTPDLPDPNIPLFARGGDVTLFRYAMFLLNKCIAQLLHGRGLPVVDMRPTLANLKRAMSAPYNVIDTSKLFGTYKWSDTECPKTQSLRSLVASERGKSCRQFNRFKDAVDGQSPKTLMSLQRHRLSRSVGSYQDEQELSAIASNTSIMGSEPNIYNTKLSQTNSADLLNRPLKSHNSDSEISRITDQNPSHSKVTFTLGDDATLQNIEDQKLVRLSYNNGDTDTCRTCLDDNVKRICTEITDFVTTAMVSEPKDDQAFDVAKHIVAINENIDIAKYMEGKMSVDIEDTRMCDSCELNKDGVCEDMLCAKNSVKDVIVIQSAEAKLDTGQGDVLFEEKDEPDEINTQT